MSVCSSWLITTTHILLHTDRQVDITANYLYTSGVSKALMNWLEVFPNKL